MTVNRKPTGRASSTPAGLLWGEAAAVTVTLAGAVITAAFIHTGTMEWKNCGYGVLITVLMAAWTGAMVAAGKIKRRRMVVCMASGAVYFGTLAAMTALFFGGQYSGAGETLLLIFCGSMVAACSGFRRKKSGIYRRKRVGGG